MALAAISGLTGCFPTQQATNAVPCIALTPRTDAVREGLKQHPETHKDVGIPVARLVLGVEAVCRK